VENHRRSVARQADIALDPRTQFDGTFERGKTVLWNAGPVKPAVSESVWTWIEGIRA
jgi:hypothetical protein